MEILHYFYQGDVKRFLSYLDAHFTKPAVRQIDNAFTKIRVPGIRKFPKGIFVLSMLTGDEVKDLLYLLPIALEGGGAPAEIVRVAVALNGYQVVIREHRFTVMSPLKARCCNFKEPTRFSGDSHKG